MPDDARPAGGSPAPAEHELLTRLGKYEIERKLGSGGMGTVFLAKDSDLKRTVALKVLAKDRAENPVLVRRFKAEGQAAAYLQHKNIVGVYDSGQIDGFLYIALEFVDGQDVLEIIRKRGVIPVKRSIEIIKQVAEGLQHAFEKQIVHRDIKPSNLLIKNDGTVKLADLGLARSIDETLDTSITRVGTTVGTVDYMSPEQARNSKATDIRSDIYSLGCTWYHMLTGVPPYGEGSVTNKLQAHATAPLPDPRSRNERVPEGVVAVLHRMMAKQAKDRYATPAELLEDLNNAGITRSGLNADVLAALAQPGGHAAPESSSGDIFESRVPFDSVELDTAVQTLRQDALPEHVIFEEDEPEAAATAADRPQPAKAPRPRPPRSKAGAEPETPRGKAPPREQRAEVDDAQPARPRRSGKDKGSSTDAVKPASLPRRQTEVERDATASVAESAKQRFKQRKLPPRGSETSVESEPVKMSLDPDRLRAIALGAVVIVVLAVLGYAFSFFGQSASDPNDVHGNAAAAPPAQPQQQPVVEPKPDVPSPGDDAGRTEAAALAGDPNDASTAARKAARPIAGAEDFADLNSPAAREFIPNWLFDVRKPIAARQPAVVVRRPGTAGAGVPTFADALEKASAGPSIIEFNGDGPFVITATSVSANNQLVLRAAAGSRPVLVFSAVDLKAGEACLRVEGDIALQGLHLVLATTTDSPAGIAMIQAGALALQDCTLQSVGPNAAGSSLIRVQPAQGVNAGCVLENCHLRSDLGDGVELASPAARLAAGNSLFSFERGSPFVIDAAPTGPGAGREVLLLRSTVIAGEVAARLSHEGGKSPASVSLVLRRSNMAASTPQATLLRLAGWPVSEESLSEKPIAIGVDWKSEQSALSGWHAMAQLVAPLGTASTTFEGDSGWQKFWRQSPAGTRLVAMAPAMPDNPGEVDAPAFAELGSTRDSDPGCRIAALPTAPVELIQRVQALAGRPRLPADFIAFRKPTAAVEFELSKASQLNAFLNDRTKCPEGALVQLRGAGYRTLPAIQIDNRVLQLEFVQAEGAPLSIRPQPGVEAEALITIRGGQVSISNGNFLLPESDRPAFPRTLIEVAGGNLALVNCTLNGPATEPQRLGPLVRWTAGETPAGMLMRDSVLTGGQSALAADLSGRILDVENSILASVSDSISCVFAEPARPAHVLLQSSTLGGGQSIVSAGKLPAGDQPVLTVVITDSVALQTSGGGKASMLRLTEAADEHRLVWWEDGVGYAAPQLPGATAESGTSDPRPWNERWGAGHVLRICSSDTAVVFESPVDTLSKAEPASFRLNPRSLAASWSSSGGFLGATGPGLGAPSEAKAPAPVEKGRSRAPVLPPTRPRTVF